MPLARQFTYVLLFILNASCTYQENGQDSVTNIRIEYIGETDKAPPIIIIGIEKPKNILPWEKFHYGTQSMLTSIKRNCVKDGWVASISTESILRVTISRSKKNSVHYLNDKASISMFLNCIIDLPDKEGDDHWLLIDLKNILNTVASYN